MKKFTVPFISILLFISVACSEEDDGSGDFEGIWIGTVINETECTNGENAVETLTCDDVECYELTLNSDGTFSYQEGFPTRSGRWSTSGGLSLCVEEDDEEVCEVYEASVNSTTLILSITDERTGCITSITFAKQ